MLLGNAKLRNDAIIKDAPYRSSGAPGEPPGWTETLQYSGHWPDPAGPLVTADSLRMDREYAFFTGRDPASCSSAMTAPASPEPIGS
jgi:hypothetical protein